MDYLPKGNRNFAFGFMVPPPGYNLDQISEIGDRIEEKLRPAWEISGDRFTAEANLRNGPLSTIDNRPDVHLMDGSVVKAPKINHYF